MNPYAWLIRIGAELALVGLCVTFWYSASAARAERDLEAAKAEAAVSQLAFIEDNADKVNVLEEEHATAERDRVATVTKKKQEARNVPTHEVPKECRAAVADFWSPFRRTLGGMREQQSARDARVAAAKTAVPQRPGSTEPAGRGGTDSRGPWRARGLPLRLAGGSALPW